MSIQKKQEPFSIRKRLLSFTYALKGVWLLFKEHNAQIHLVATIIAIMLGVILRISTFEWIIIILLIGIVLAAEAGNSALERLADKISLNHHPLLGEAKDLAAAAVLFCATAAAIIGIIIFLPKIIKLIF